MKDYKILKISLFPTILIMIIAILYLKKLFVSHYLIANVIYFLGFNFDRITFIDTMGLSFLITFLLLIIIIKLISIFTCDKYIKKGINIAIYTLYIFSFLSLILTLYIWLF